MPDHQIPEKGRRIIDRAGCSRGELLQRLAIVVLDSNDAVTLLDMDGNILAWNRGAVEMYGYPEDKALETNIISMVPEGERAAYSEMMAGLRRGEAIRSFQTKRVTKDGQVLDVWLTVTVLKDEAGRPYNISTTERDITGIKQTEESLRASNEELKVSEEELKSNIEELNSSQEQLREKVEELKATEEPLRRLATVVRDSNDAIMLIDFECNIQAWNRGAEQIYGYSEDEMLNKNIQVLFPSGGEMLFLDILKRLRAGENITSYETRRVARDGRILDIWLTLTALMDEAGRPYMIATTERDVTGIKRNEAALKDTLEKLQFETEQLETSGEELEVTNEELLSTNNELDMALKDNEEKKSKLDYYSITFLGMLQEPMSSLNASIGALMDEMKGDVSPERRKMQESLLSADRKAFSSMQDVSALLKIFSSEVHVERVDLSKIVASILEKFERDDPSASVKVFVPRMLYAYVDKDLIGIALQYLLWDSWVHVRGNAAARIMFMLVTDPAGFSFAINDNREDYMGTGPKWLLELEGQRAEMQLEEAFHIALAKLIIEKNGGSVWADNKKGVYSVHFKLPISPTA